MDSITLESLENEFYRKKENFVTIFMYICAFFSICRFINMMRASYRQKKFNLLFITNFISNNSVKLLAHLKRASSFVNNISDYNGL